MRVGDGGDVLGFRDGRSVTQSNHHALLLQVAEGDDNELPERDLRGEARRDRVVEGHFQWGSSSGSLLAGAPAKRDVDHNFSVHVRLQPVSQIIPAR